MSEVTANVTQGQDYDVHHACKIASVEIIENIHWSLPPVPGTELKPLEFPK